MTLKRGLFLAALLSVNIQLNALAQTSTTEIGAQVVQPPAATAEVSPVAAPPAAVERSVPAAISQPQPAASTVEVTPAVPAQQPPIAPGPDTVPPAPITGAGAAQSAVEPSSPANKQQSITAKDFLLRQEELNYGVSLVSKAAKIRIPFESNPILIENKEELKKVVGRLFADVKDLPDNLNAMAVNLMTYKKEDKEQDFGLIALELKDAARADAETFKGLIKTSMLNYFKEESFYIADKFPLIVIVAHNYPEGKKEDIKWAFDLAQKKFEK